MDGFEGNIGIIIIVVINCFDVLDVVLFCFGCFDCQVVVDCFDYVGCFEIFNVYVCGKSFFKDVDLEKIVCWIFGFIGVDLFNLLNEGVILVVCCNLIEIFMDEVNDFIDWVLVGLEKKD